MLWRIIIVLKIFKVHCFTLGIHKYDYLRRPWHWQQSCHYLIQELTSIEPRSERSINWSTFVVPIWYDLIRHGTFLILTGVLSDFFSFNGLNACIFYFDPKSETYTKDLNTWTSTYSVQGSHNKYRKCLYVKSHRCRYFSRQLSQSWYENF